MGEKPGVIGNANKAYQELITTLKHLFGRIKVNHYVINITPDIKDIRAIEESKINYLSTKMDKSIVNFLDERQILKSEYIAVHFSKLKFAIFSLPTNFPININYVRLTKILTKTYSSKPIKNILSISRVEPVKDLFCGVKKIAMKPFSSKVFEGIKYFERIPYKVRPKNFKNFNAEEIIGFWNLLLSKAQIPRTDLELVGVFEPVPLHKIKKINFNNQDGSLNLFIDMEKRYSNHPPARVIVGRDKKDGRVFTVVVPL